MAKKSMIGIKQIALRIPHKRVSHQDMAKNRIKIANILHIFINQGQPWLIDVLNNHYELNTTQIHRSHEDYGHMGNIDTWFGLQTRSLAKQIKPNDYCLLLASGYGFSWSGHLIQH